MKGTIGEDKRDIRGEEDGPHRAKKGRSGVKHCDCSGKFLSEDALRLAECEGVQRASEVRTMVVVREKEEKGRRNTYICKRTRHDNGQEQPSVRLCKRIWVAGYRFSCF